MTLDLRAYDFGDWSDLSRAHEKASELMNALVADKKMMAQLFDGVRDNPALFAMSETLTLDDKVVLYDGLESQGFRLRLHVSTGKSTEVAHDHRFPLTTKIMTGGYIQRIYTGPAENPTGCIAREEPPGACYTLDDSAIHSNIAMPNTTLLIVRGPTRKKRAQGKVMGTGQIYYKEGARDESADVKERHKMTLQRLEQLRLLLAELNVI